MLSPNPCSTTIRRVEFLSAARTSSAFAPAPVYREPPKPVVPEIYAAMQGTWEINQNVNNNALMMRRLLGQPAPAHATEDEAPRDLFA